MSEDITRATLGVQRWEDYGRHLSNFLSGFLHTSSNLTDISPLPQVLALAFVAFAAVIMLHLVTGKRQFSLWELFLTIPVGLSPYFLQNLSFRFDAPYMALSVLAATIPFLFQPAGKRIRLVVSILSLLIVTMTYQAGLSVYLVLAVFLGFKKWYEGASFRELFNEWLLSGAGFVIALLLFRFVFFSEPNAAYSYSSNGLIWNEEFSNPWWFVIIYRYGSLVVTIFLRDMPVRWVLSLIAVASFYLLHRVLTSQQKQLFSLLMAMTELVLLVLAGLWLLPFLEKFGTNPRILFGVMVAIALLMMSLWQTSSSLLKCGKLFPCVVSWFFLSYAFTYGNAMAAQKEYSQNQATTISQILLREVPQLTEQKRLLKVETSDSTRTVAPRVQHVSQGYPLLARSIVQSDGILRRKVLEYLNQPNLLGFKKQQPQLENEKQVDLVYQDAAYSIYVTEETIYVILNKVNDNNN